MALDNAQFISELSITDPPGTDPLSEGDDQIRTTKRATQQSFPNIDAAVTLTAAQMNDVALQSEANVFTQLNTFQDVSQFNAQIFGSDGSAAAPGYAFSNQGDMGLYRESATALGFAAGGVSRFRVETAQILSQVLHTFDAVGTQFFAFANVITKTSTSGIAGFTYEDANAVGRWLMGQSTAANGERFTLQRRDSGGNVLDSPWEVLNTDGHVQMLQMNMIRSPDTASTALFWNTAGTVTRWTLSFEGTSGFNPNSLTFTAFNSSGTFQNNPFRLGPNGTLFMEALPTVNPGVAGQLWRNPVSPGFVAIV